MSEERDRLEEALNIDLEAVKQFNALDVKGKDRVTIYIGPEVALIQTAKWPRDEKGKVTGIGESQTITLHRHTLIGLAYEILRSVDINRVV